MKKLLLLVIILISASCLDNEKIKDEIFPNIATKAKIEDLDLPNGSIIKKIGNSKIKITLPKGYEIWRVNKDHKLQITSEAYYTCECSSGTNGCNVFYVKGVYGCSHSKCTGSCIGTFNNSFTHEDLYKKLFIVNKNAKLEVATERDFENLKYIPEGLVLNMRKELRDFAIDLYGDNFLTSVKQVDRSFRDVLENINDIVYVKMKIYGYKFIYGVNINYLNSDLIRAYPSITVSKDYSCRCESGKTGCQPFSDWGVQYCKAKDCTKCSMNLN